MKLKIISILVLCLTICGCATSNIDVRPKGDVTIGGGVGG